MKIRSKSQPGVPRQCVPLASKRASDPLHHASPPPAEGAPTQSGQKHPAGMPKIPLKRQKHPHFGSFLPAEKNLTCRISAIQSARNTISPTILNAKSPKVAKNNPMPEFSASIHSPYVPFVASVLYVPSFTLQNIMTFLAHYREHPASTLANIPAVFVNCDRSARQLSFRAMEASK